MGGRWGIIERAPRHWSGLRGGRVNGGQSEEGRGGARGRRWLPAGVCRLTGRVGLSRSPTSSRPFFGSFLGLFTTGRRREPLPRPPLPRPRQTPGTKGVAEGRAGLKGGDAAGSHLNADPRQSSSWRTRVIPPARRLRGLWGRRDEASGGPRWGFCRPLALPRALVLSPAWAAAASSLWVLWQIF